MTFTSYLSFFDHITKFRILGNNPLACFRSKDSSWGLLFSGGEWLIIGGILRFKIDEVSLLRQLEKLN